MKRASTDSGAGQGAAQPEDAQAISERREHFVPIRKEDLIELLCHDPDLSAKERADFRELSRILEATFHFEYHATLEDLKNAYAFFNPDIDAPPRATLSEAERAGRMDGFFEKLEWVLARANFTRLSREDIEAVLGQASAWGVNLDIDLDAFARLEVYARGAVIDRRTLRRLRTGLRLKELDVPIYQRLVVVFRLKEDKRFAQYGDPRMVYIKVFKDIPRIDLEMLLPGARVRMSRLDKLKIFAPATIGVGIGLWRLFAATFGESETSVYGLIFFLGLVGGAVGYGIRSLYSYLRTKEKYQHILTRSLYFQNLDNNAGVLFRLLDEAEEQECREAILGYFLLWRRAGERGWTVAELNDHAEAYIGQLTGRDVDYDVEDALRKFKALKLVEELAGGRLRAVPIAEALATIDETWNDYFQYSTALPASCRKDT